MLKWGGIVFGIGIALMIMDIMMARKKKGGMTPTDKQRIAGIFWLACLLSLGTMGLIWLFPDN